jgi:bifunctional non-homologous end joining protein LigD
VLQNELKGKSTKIVMVTFDLLYLNGYDLRKLPLFERKALLKKNIDGMDIQFSESFEVDGGEMFKHACKPALRASSQRFEIADIQTGVLTTGSRKPAPSARH